ncbi:MAG: hypothetical protein RL172_2392 [Bacteroidota bacterium]
MGILSFLKRRKPFFSPKEMEDIVQSIRDAERQTSGEIRVFVESKNPLVSTIERAAETFFMLKMDQTAHRNAVLLYLAIDHHEVALFGDQGIYELVGGDYWQKEVKEMTSKFTRHDIPGGIINCIHHIGQTLKEKFPYEAVSDKNELPDNIVFGK